MTAHLLKLALATALVTAPPALAAGPVVDPGPVAAVGSGLGHTVFVVPADDGTFTLRDVEGDGPPVTLDTGPRPGLPSSITVGDGPTDGDATAIVETCDELGCTRLAYNLEARRARELRLPAPPRGCFDRGARYERRRVFVVRSGLARCRHGIYELRRGRLVRRLALPSEAGGDFDVENGWVVFTRTGKDRKGLRFDVIVQGLRSSRRRVVHVDRSQGFDCEVAVQLELLARRLNLGIQQLCAEGPGRSGQAIRIDLRRRLRCSTIAVPEEERGSFVDWTFSLGRILYRRTRSDGQIELARWTSTRFPAAGACS